MKLTPWFPANIKPVRVGPYEVQVNSTYAKGRSFQYWNGSEWRFRDGSPTFAMELRHYRTFFESPVWRGLTEEADTLPLQARGARL